MNMKKQLAETKKLISISPIKIKLPKFLIRIGNFIKYSFLLCVSLILIVLVLANANGSSYSNNMQPSPTPNYSMYSSKQQPSRKVVSAEELNSFMTQFEDKAVVNTPIPTSTPSDMVTCYVAIDGKFEMTKDECMNLSKNDSWKFITEGYENCLNGLNPQVGNSGNKEDRVKACDEMFHYSENMSIRNQGTTSNNTQVTNQEQTQTTGQISEEEYKKSLDKAYEQCMLDNKQKTATNDQVRFVTSTGSVAWNPNGGYQTGTHTDPAWKYCNSLIYGQ